MSKGKGRPANQRPRSGRGPTYTRPGGGGGGTGGNRGKGPKGGMSSSVTGPVRAAVGALAAFALLFVGTPVAYIVWQVTT